MLLAAIAVALVGVQLWEPAEPAYHGKGVSFWIEQTATGTTDRSEATNAFWQIGPRVLPSSFAAIAHPCRNSRAVLAALVSDSEQWARLRCRILVDAAPVAAEPQSW